MKGAWSVTIVSQEAKLNHDRAFNSCHNQGASTDYPHGWSTYSAGGTPSLPNMLWYFQGPCGAEVQPQLLSGVLAETLEGPEDFAVSRLSLAFKSLCESVKSGNQATGRNDVCSLHEEKFKLFCYEEKQPICVICHVSKQHENHKCSPLQEAAQDLKVKILCYSTWTILILGSFSLIDRKHYFSPKCILT